LRFNAWLIFHHDFVEHDSNDSGVHTFRLIALKMHGKHNLTVGGFGVFVEAQVELQPLFVVWGWYRNSDSSVFSVPS
jgi:hypothetical protein